MFISLAIFTLLSSGAARAQDCPGPYQNRSCSYCNMTSGISCDFSSSGSGVWVRVGMDGDDHPIVYGYNASSSFCCDAEETSLYWGTWEMGIQGTDYVDDIRIDGTCDPEAPVATISGGTGDDILYGSMCTTCSEAIYGDGGDDTIHGGDGDDDIWGCDSNTPCSDSGSDDDQIWGDDGDDVIYGQDGDDTIFGGNGADIVYADRENPASCTGLEYADDVFGGAGDDELYGGCGVDEIDGGGDDDVVNGDEGNDILCGGSGDYDQMIGESGDDELYDGVFSSSYGAFGGLGTDDCPSACQPDPPTAGCVDCSTYNNGSNCPFP
jgi:Ca2+-binding RTX toxin-like protein